MFDKRLIKEITGHKKYFFMMAIHGIWTFLYSVMMALMISDIINSIFIEKQNLRENYITFLYFLLLVLIKMLFTFYSQRYFKRAASELKNNILKKTVKEFLNRGPVETRRLTSGNAAAAWSEAAEQVERYYSEYLPQFAALIISVPMLFVVAMFWDLISALIMLATGPLLPFFLALIGMQSGEANQKRLKSLGNLGAGLLDFLNGIGTLKIFHGEEEYRKFIVKNSEEFRKKTMQVLKIAFLSAFVLEFAATISTAMIAVLLGIRLIYGNIEFHTAFFILLITPDYYMTIRRFGAKFHTAMGAKAAADRLYEYAVDEKVEKETEFLIEQPEAIQITLNNVSYQYKDSQSKALNHISMTMEKNKVTAIVGKSGSGKSTLSYLLMQFVEAEGLIYFNQYVINYMEPALVRTYISYIPQKPHIFHDTLRNNLLLAKKDATEAQLQEAIQKSALEELVKNLPEGLDTVLTETGSNISIGEAQRIAFARACLKNCPIIIMDEISSALDKENERLLRLSFEEMSKDKTVVIIAHRLETVKNADMIYVLEDGSIKENGNHEKLLSLNGCYRELVDNWGVAY